jgi:hypothetical protein
MKNQQNSNRQTSPEETANLKDPQNPKQADVNKADAEKGSNSDKSSNNEPNAANKSSDKSGSTKAA